MGKDRIVSATAKVYTGIANMGTDIFVARPKLEEAKELIAAYMNCDFVEAEDTENE